MIIKKNNRKHDIYNETNNNENVCRCYPLNSLFLPCPANFTRTMPSLLVIKQTVNQASQANAKRRFKEQEDQTSQAGYASYDAIGI